jgi:hypothetical protein
MPAIGNGPVGPAVNKNEFSFAGGPVSKVAELPVKAIVPTAIVPKPATVAVSVAVPPVKV